MIKLSNIHISYPDVEVIQASELTLFSGTLTIIKGVSGSGKSSLLKLLALEETFEAHYLFDDESINTLSQDKINNYRQTKIAYVDQFNSLMNDFKVIDNLEWLSILRYGNVKKQEINQLLKQMHLYHLKNKKTKRLSGGEKQRLMIACAILKDTDLYLFDEPTAMLDIESKSIIVQAIEQLAKAGKIVLVATHEDEFFNASHVYRIENNSIIEEVSPTQKNQFPTIKKEAFLSKAISSLSLKYTLNHFLFNALMLVVISICLSIATENYAATKTSVAQVRLDVNDIYNQEIFVTNRTYDSFVGYGDDEGFFAIDDSIFQEISEMEQVSSIEPFMYFPMNEGQIDENGAFFTTPPEEYMQMTLKQNGNTIKTITHNEMEFDGKKEVVNAYAAIYATYEHQQFDQRCTSTDDGEGIYISQHLAKELGLTALDNHSLIIHFSIPIASTPALYLGSVDAPDEQFIRTWFNIAQQREFKIIGILSDTPLNTYSMLLDCDIYMPIDMMKQMQTECFETHQQAIENASTKSVSKAMAKYCDSAIYEKEWNWSGAVVVINDHQLMDYVINEIESLDENLRADKVIYEDRTMQVMDYNTIYFNTMMLYVFMIVLATIIGTTIIKIFKRLSRKNDYACLSRHGFSLTHINKIEKMETYIELLVVSFLGCLFSFHHIDFTILLFTTLLSIVVMQTSSWLSRKAIKK